MKPIPKANLVRWTLPWQRMFRVRFHVRHIADAVDEQLETWQPDFFDTLFTQIGLRYR